MATVKNGLTPYKTKAGEPYTGGRSRFLIKNGYATALGQGDPVKVSNGFVKLATNTSDGVTGVFAGCKYIDMNTKQPVESGYWPANTSSAGVLEGETHALGYITNADDLTYIAVADGSVSAALLGATFRVSTGTPDSLTKRSTARVHASANASADQYLVRVVGFPNIAGTRPGDANTIVEVELVSPRLVQG